MKINQKGCLHQSYDDTSRHKRNVSPTFIWLFFQLGRDNERTGQFIPRLYILGYLRAENCRNSFINFPNVEKNLYSSSGKIVRPMPSGALVRQNNFTNLLEDGTIFWACTFYFVKKKKKTSPNFQSNK